MTNLFKLTTVLFVLIAFATGTLAKSSLPAQGVIPDEATAVKVAEAVFLPIFGKDEVARYFPYHAHLKDGIWTVYGTLKPGSRGGTPQMTVQKKDGKVLEIWHSQ